MHAHFEQLSSTYSESYPMVGYACFAQLFTLGEPVSWHGMLSCMYVGTEEPSLWLFQATPYTFKDEKPLSP